MFAVLILIPLSGFFPCSPISIPFNSSFIVTVDSVHSNPLFPYLKIHALRLYVNIILYNHEYE